MDTSSIYRTLLTEEYVKEQLQLGNNLTNQDIETYINNLIDNFDLTLPQFAASSYYVTEFSSSSAAAFNSTFEKIRQDLKVLYKTMISLTKVSTASIERWRIEATQLEKKLIDLEERIENLLILTQDTEGHQAVIIDNFSDTSKTDLSISTTEIDLETQSVEMTNTSSDAIERVFFNDLDLRRDVNFKIRTTNNFIGREDSAETDLTDIFKQQSQTWWSSIRMKKPQPVTCELLVQLDPEETVSISRIFLDLLHSAESSPLYITPLYSTDNINYSQLPTNTFSIKAKTNALFNFTEVEARWIKFLITKRAPDTSSSVNDFSYQFGFKNIHFYKQSFASGVDNKQQFFSKPLSVVDQNNEIVEFEKITLETCECIETDTEINYFITASNNVSDIETIDSSTVWFPISPVNHANPKYPQVLDIGDIDSITIGDTETVKVSYDASQIGIDDDAVNPATSFNILSLNSTTGAIVDTATTSNVVRYSFSNENNRILNYQIKDTTYSGDGNDPLFINENTIELFRNVGEKGLTSGPTANQVRGIQRGWGFSDPYYTCVIEITNPEGIEIDVGNQAIIIDDIKYINKIGNTVLTGKTSTQSGLHKIKIHKNNWKEVEPELNDLASLKVADILYPYNHKLLIEGYKYGAGYDTTTEQIYTGVDLFAELLMKRTSPFDISNNIKSNNFNYFALDRDAPNSHTETSNSPTRVFVVKVNEENTDFVNERFVIRFSQINQLQKYMRLRADFITDNEAISPSLFSYKLKVG